jgi:hypothetical protein
MLDEEVNEKVQAKHPMGKKTGTKD